MADIRGEAAEVMFSKDAYASPLQHAHAIAAWVSSRLIRKYLRGAQEHGGCMWRKPTLDHIEGEIMDLLPYFHQLKRQHEGGTMRLKDAIARRDWALAQEALNVLTVGNPEGQLEEEH